MGDRDLYENVEMKRFSSRDEELLQRLSCVWKYQDGKIYYFSSERKPWQGAEDFCVSKRSHLVSVTSATEQEYLARQAGTGFCWIGLTDHEQEGIWRWVDGTEYRQKASFWPPGQPDITVYGSKAGNDHNCKIPFPWICKNDLDADRI